MTGTLHSCWSGSCGSCDHFDTCAAPSEDEEDLDAGDVTELFAALQTGDDDALASVLPRFDRVASFNSERHAIQLMGCGNAIVAHIPVSTGSELYSQFADRQIAGVSGRLRACAARAIID